MILSVGQLGGSADTGAEHNQQDMKITKDIEYVHRRWFRSAMTSMDIYEPTDISEDPRPILLFVHGGGWAIGDKRRIEHKAEWATDLGMVYISVNYRLSPRVMHPEHARDVAASIAYAIEHADEWNADPERIVVMGHSSGAHLAGIVASDESLLEEHDLKPTDLTGVILLDGAGYDIEAQMTDPNNNRILKRWYENAFGNDPQLWEQASPTMQARPGDALPPMMAVYTGDREQSRQQALDLVQAWKSAGARTEIHHASEKDHSGLNTELGALGDSDTKVIEAFLDSVLGEEE
jgi:acetyl esterase/lipase